jgi:hypothetical protein
MSFWKNKPVSIKQVFTSNLIVTADTLLENSSKEMETGKIQLDYDVILNPDTYTRQQMLNFINKNYGDDKSDLVLEYSQELFDYFIKPDNLCIVFYARGNRLNNAYNFPKMIGLIIAKKHQLFIRDKTDTDKATDNTTEKIIENNITSDKIETYRDFKVYDCIDVDFLCLIQKLRNMHVSSFMINAVTKECMIQYDKTVACAVYTVGKRLAVENFCKKTYYHRPINIENVLKTDMLSVSDCDDEETGSRLLKRVYNSFSYPRSFFDDRILEYFTNFDDYETDKSIFTDVIYNNLFSYSCKTYDIFEHRTREDILNMLKNPVFHKFVIRDQAGIIKDFVCLYNLDTRNGKINDKSRNGHFYTWFLSNPSNEYLSYVLEAISEYSYNNNIFDMITIMNIFNARPEDYKTFKLLRGSADLYYYVYNIEVPKIMSHKNGLVTI